MGVPEAAHVVYLRDLQPIETKGMGFHQAEGDRVRMFFEETVFAVPVVVGLTVTGQPLDVSEQRGAVQQEGVDGLEGGDELSFNSS